MGGQEREKPGRLLAVGDIHGCLDALRRLMNALQPEAADRIVFLGDYIDRGPDSRGVIDYLLDFRRHFPQTVFLKGNHEQMFLDFLAGRDRLNFLFNGGESTLKSYGGKKNLRIPAAHRDFLESLPPYHETDRFIFVHAGLRPGVPLKAQREFDLLWIRAEFINSDYDWGKTVVFGHTPLQETLWRPNKIGLDTGAVYGQTLTACDVETRRCWNSGR